MFKKFFKKTNSPSKRKSFNFLDFNNLGYSDQGTITAGVDTYLRNVIVYRCVNLIAQSASHVPWLVKKVSSSGEIINIENHPVLKLFRKPNPEKAGAEFFGEVIANKLLYGNAYILAASLKNSPPREIYLLSPTATELVLNRGQAVSYQLLPAQAGSLANAYKAD